MSTKNRILETDDGHFMPQFKCGWLSSWRFYTPAADKHYSAFVILMSENDPAKAASFLTAEEAKSFINRIMARANAYWQEKYASRARAVQGVKVRNKLDVEAHR